MPLTCDGFSTNSYQSPSRMELRSVRSVLFDNVDASVFRFTWDKLTVNFTRIVCLLPARDFWSNPVLATFVRGEGDRPVSLVSHRTWAFGFDASWWLASQLFLTTARSVKRGEEVCTPSSNIFVLKFVKQISGVCQALIINHCHL
jgi:hypothetical protein